MLDTYTIKTLNLAKQEIVSLIKYYHQERVIGRVSSFDEYEAKEYVQDRIMQIAPHFKKLNHAYKVVWSRASRMCAGEPTTLPVYIYVVKTESYLEIWSETYVGEIKPNDVLLDPDNDPLYRRTLTRKFALPSQLSPQQTP